jgi:hypothetical protein
LKREETRRAERGVQLRVIILTKEVKVLAQRAGEELRLCKSQNSNKHEYVKPVQTAWGMIVMFERSASRLMDEVGISS